MRAQLAKTLDRYSGIEHIPDPQAAVGKLEEQVLQILGVDASSWVRREKAELIRAVLSGPSDAPRPHRPGFNSLAPHALLARIDAITTRLLKYGGLKIAFPNNPSQLADQPEVTAEKSLEKGGSKYSELISLLLHLGVDALRDMSVAEEKIDRESGRFPRKIVHVRLPKGVCTICLSDEPGTPTYVYDGMIDLLTWSLSRWEPISNLVPSAIIPHDAYAEHLKIALFVNGESAQTRTREKPENTSARSQVSDTAPLQELLFFQSQLLEIREELAMAGIVSSESGIWYFWDAKGIRHWPKVGERLLGSFPSCTFNKKHEIGTRIWQISGRRELAKMFGVLGLRVATEEEEKARWANMLIEAAPEFARAGIRYSPQEGIWYFGKGQKSPRWPIVNGRHTKVFPNTSFNKERGIGDKEWKNTNLKELAKMFRALGLRVATEEEERAIAPPDMKEKQEETKISTKVTSDPKWAEMLIEAAPKFANAWVFYENGIWYFGDAEKMPRWLQVNNTRLNEYPNRAFNKAHGIGNEKWEIVRLAELADVFRLVGLRVATEEEEKVRWANMLVEGAEELAQMWIFLEDDIWYFEGASGNLRWAKIGKRTMATFPNPTFNKSNGLGTLTGAITDFGEFARMFRTLDLRVATEEEERNRMEQESRLSRLTVGTFPLP